MRAPSERFSAYSEAQWEVIKGIVAELNVDADKVAWLYDEEGRPVTENGMSLRRLMEQSLEFYDARKRVEARIPTLKARIATLIKQRDQIAAVQRFFLAPDLETHARVNAVLESNARELTARINFWGQKTKRFPNAFQLGLELLREHLLRIWMLLGGEPQGARCVRFLVAAMAPVYRAATTSVATRRWLDRQGV
jgi:predicted unusual protein kinase regulating ubiquinone biosynthesis (AarF/ABC1/UbiB family)